MSAAPRTTRPLDVEVQLSTGVIYPALSSQTELYASWLAAQTAPNPIDSLNAFFTNVGQLIVQNKLDVEFHQYWYDKLKTGHKAVFASLSATQPFLDINEAVGTLYFAQADCPTTSISDIAGATLKPYPGNIESLLPAGLGNTIIGAYTTVNTAYVGNVGNIQTNPGALPTAAHGVSLVKDTIANTRNSDSIPLVKAKLEDKFGKTLDLTEIENIITGDLAIPYTQFTDIVEGISTPIDALTNKVDPTLSTLKITSLQAL
jgi:hypothetical protein